MSIKTSGSYTPVSLVSGIPLEVNASFISESLVGQESPDSLEGDKSSIILQSIYNLPVNLTGSTLISLIGKMDAPVLTPYVNTGLMLYLDAENTGSGQTWGEAGGGGDFTNSYMWESLDNYNPGSPYTVVSSSGASDVPSPGDSIEVTGSVAFRLDDASLSGWEDPFDTTFGTLALELNGTSHRAPSSTGISNVINDDNGASLWRFEDLRQFSIELWVYRQSGSGAGAQVFFHIKAEHGIRLQFDTAQNRFRTILGGAGAGSWITANDTFYANSWHHIVVTVDKSNSAVRAYKNGSLIGWAQTGGVTNINTFNTVKNPTLRIGSRWGGNYFKGAVAIIRAYDFPLTAAQVSKNYNAELSRFV